MEKTFKMNDNIYNPPFDNDNFYQPDHMTDDEQYIMSRMVRGEYVTRDNSGLDGEKWEDFLRRIGRAA